MYIEIHATKSFTFFLYVSHFFSIKLTLLIEVEAHEKSSVGYTEFPWKKKSKTRGGEREIKHSVEITVSDDQRAYITMRTALEMALGLFFFPECGYRSTKTTGASVCWPHGRPTDGKGLTEDPPRVIHHDLDRPVARRRGHHLGNFIKEALAVVRRWHTRWTKLPFFYISRVTYFSRITSQSEPLNLG